MLLLFSGGWLLFVLFAVAVGVDVVVDVAVVDSDVAAAGVGCILLLLFFWFCVVAVPVANMVEMLAVSPVLIRVAQITFKSDNGVGRRTPYDERP